MNIALSLGVRMADRHAGAHSAECRGGREDIFCDKQGQRQGLELVWPPETGLRHYEALASGRVVVCRVPQKRKWKDNPKV